MKRWRVIFRAVLATALLVGLQVNASFAGPENARQRLPRGMVYLRDIDASIKQDMRYAGRHNFLGRPVAGYGAARCILTKNTAQALHHVQKRLRAMRLSLKVYDCYRPRRAVRDFLRWARRAGDQTAKDEFYPTIDKRELFARRYISKRSKHSHGNTVDLTIVPRGSRPPVFDPSFLSLACHLPQTKRAPDNSLDFGTGYDCFHRRSGSGLPRRYKVAWKNRRLLNRLMRDNGFYGYFREWWHFSLRGAGTARPMNFPIR